MRYPRLLFAVLTLVICLLLDFSLRQMHSSPVPPGAGRMVQGQVSEPLLSVPPLSSSPDVLIARTENVDNEPVPVVSPPSFRAPDKPEGLLPPPALSPQSTVIVEAPLTDMPEPKLNKTGLLLLNFVDAVNLCSKENKRLPTIMDAAKWAAHNGALVASVDDAKKLHRDNAVNAIYLQRGAQTQTVDFYFDRDRFIYPVNLPITNASIWTSDERNLGGTLKAKHYAFSLYEARFSPVPETSALAVVCIDKK